MDVEFELTEDVQNKVLLVGMETVEQFERVNNYIKTHLQQLN